jgi:biopolymer transport protein ExbD
LEIALPQSATAAEAATTRSPVLVSVDSAEEVYVGDRPVPLSGLRAAVEELLRATPETEFGLQVDKAVPFQTVVKVLDALKEAGVENLPAFTEKTE